MDDNYCTDDEWDEEQEEYENLNEIAMSQQNEPPEPPPPLIQRRAAPSPQNPLPTPTTRDINQNSSAPATLPARSTFNARVTPPSSHDEVYETPDDSKDKHAQFISRRGTINPSNRPLPVPPKETFVDRNTTTPLQTTVTGPKAISLPIPPSSYSRGFPPSTPQVQISPKARLPPPVRDADLSSTSRKFQSQNDTMPIIPARMNRQVPQPPGANIMQRRPSVPEMIPSEDYLAPDELMEEAKIQNMADRRPSLPFLPPGKHPSYEFATNPNDSPSGFPKKPAPRVPCAAAPRSKFQCSPTLPTPTDDEDLYEAPDDDLVGQERITNFKENDSPGGFPKKPASQVPSAMAARSQFQHSPFITTPTDDEDVYEAPDGDEDEQEKITNIHERKPVGSRDSTDSYNKPGVGIGLNTLINSKQRLRPVLSNLKLNKSEETSTSHENVSNGWKLSKPSQSSVQPSSPFRAAGVQPIEPNKKITPVCKPSAKPPPSSPPTSPFTDFRKIPLIPSHGMNRTSDGSTDNRSSASSTMSTDSGQDSVTNGAYPRSASLDPLEKKSWYFGDIARNVADAKVSQLTEDGSFLIRKSEKGGSEQLYTLCILCKKEIFNIPLRKRFVDGKYAVGSAGKANEQIFNSVEEIVSFHGNNGLEIFKKDKHYKITFKGSPKKT